jgi:acyl transferase domain-containing protein
MSEVPVNGQELSPVKRALLEIRQLRAQLAAVQRSTREPIAIIGAAVRLPGGVTDLETFWTLLNADDDGIEPIPFERWDADALFSPDADAAGKTTSRHGGFLTGIDQFDAAFFGISPREAESMDPQHRLLLELTWEALENAAIAPAAVSGSKAGVFVGLSNSDYGRLLMDDPATIDAYTSFGVAGSIAAGRISYFLNAKGPSLVVDTACSSSLTAVHLACTSLALGEADLALAGATNLLLTPGTTIALSKARMLAPDGRCKTFDDAADGYVRGEGGAVVVLKRLSDARAAGDPIMAVIRSSAINHDGRSAGLTAPNGPAQQAVIESALRSAGVEPAAIDYVETHGTGTSLGDPIELQALANVFAPSRRPALAIGSIKRRVGHLEAVGGLAGLIKLALALDREALPAHGPVGNPTSMFTWDGSGLEILEAARDWRRGERSRIAGVSAFSFSGTNVHAVIEEAPAAAATTPAPDSAWFFCLSAKSESALRELVKRYVDWLPATDAAVADICYTLCAGRSHHRHRFAARVSTKADLLHDLRAWLDGTAVPNVLTGTAEDPAPETAFVYRPGADDAEHVAQKHYVTGATIAWEHVDGSARRVSGLPAYPFERRTYWRPRTAAEPAPQAVPWPQILAAAAQQSESGPLGWNVDAYAERWERFDALMAGHAANTLAALGAFRTPGETRTVDDLITAYAIKPIYRNLVRRWLLLLVQCGELRSERDAFICDHPMKRRDLTAEWVEVERLLADDPDTLAYARRASSKLIDLLTGRTIPLEVLFEHGALDTAEGIYERSPAARYFNAVVAAAVRVAFADHDPREPFRLLEAGAGTGGTTAALAPLFPADSEYWFTDVSDAFLARAKRKFSDNAAFRFAKLDLEAPVGGEFPIGACDVVLAANVVHATRDVGATLDRMRQFLKPGGILILLETTTHHAVIDMTIGFVEGWSAFEDPYRSDHPLLEADRWRAVALEHGFADAARFPAAGSPADGVGQHVIVAYNAQSAALTGDRAVVAAAPDVHAHIPAPQLEGLRDHDRREQLRVFAAACVRHVLQLDEQTNLGLRERFTDLGMDSLMALQLKGLLESQLRIEGEIPATIAFDAGTVEALAEQLFVLVSPRAAAVVAVTRSDEMISAEQLSQISDEEVEAMLAQRLRGKSNAVGR